jgi:DNA modification methylase
LDPFVGSGSTLIGCAKMGRRGIGVDCNPYAIKVAKNSLKKIEEHTNRIEVHLGDARNLDFIKSGSIDFILTSPPYWITLTSERRKDARVGERKSDLTAQNSYAIYNQGKGNLGNIKRLDDFLGELRKAFTEMHRVLRGEFAVVIIGDTWRVPERNRVPIWDICPLHIRVIQVAESVGFRLHDIFIWHRQKPRFTYPKSMPFPRSIIMHEYVLVFRKIG